MRLVAAAKVRRARDAGQPERIDELGHRGFRQRLQRQATPDRTASQRRPARVAVAGISAAGLVGTGYCKS